jgi:GNAT superfamily N-acetyltransferase
MPADAAIRLLTDRELDGALALSTSAGWNQRQEDWRMLLQLAPSGSYGAIAGGRVVGTAIGIDYGRFGWIAMMLVDPAFRGRGLGAQLLEAAMAALPADRPIRLDATPLGRPLYQRYGFEDEQALSRQVAEPGERRPDAGQPDRNIRRLTESELEMVRPHDRVVFGGDRGAVLEWSWREAPQYAWFAPGASGVPQYCFGRSGRLFDHIGPVVAETADVARALAAAALGAVTARPAVLDTFDQPADFPQWLATAGFRVQRPLFRMCRAGKAAACRNERAPSLGEYAILGPEFA